MECLAIEENWRETSPYKFDSRWWTSVWFGKPHCRFDCALGYIILNATIEGMWQPMSMVLRALFFSLSIALAGKRPANKTPLVLSVSADCAKISERRLEKTHWVQPGVGKVAVFRIAQMVSIFGGVTVTARNHGKEGYIFVSRPFFVCVCVIVLTFFLSDCWTELEKQLGSHCATWQRGAQNLVQTVCF